MTAIAIIVACAALKVLLVPAYRSTDFEVHRNWLAVTHSLPLRQWYVDETSPWTLDYPPFFAWFEWALSQAAALVDPGMLVVGNLGYASPATVLFQRLTVIASEALLLWAVWRATRSCRRPVRLAALFLVAAHPGLLIVDHIHFQYNGVLLGLFVLSLTAVAEGRDLTGGALFAALLCCKHIFLYCAPLYFVHLLRHYCRGPRAVPRFLALGASVALVFGLAFGPFVAAGQLPQLLRRLFPFGRGLLHAYWAPNVWALYAAADKALAAAARLAGLHLHVPAASMTGGLVAVQQFSVLPQVGSGTCALATLAAMAPCLIATWRDPRRERLPAAALYCTMCSFMLGYHVHEKAALMVVVPLALAAATSGEPQTASDYLFLNTVACYSLFPLLFGPDEYPIKVLALVGYTAAAAACMQALAPTGTRRRGAALPRAGWRLAYLWGLCGVELCTTWLHPLLLGSQRLPFLPLMATSLYCAAGMCVGWWGLARPFLPPRLGGSCSGGGGSKRGKRRQTGLDK